MTLRRLENELDQALNPASRVKLSENKDALGMPRALLEWRLSAVDKRSARRTQQLLARARGPGAPSSPRWGPRTRPSRWWALALALRLADHLLEELR